MKPNWIVVADRKSARVFVCDRTGAPIHLITELLNYEGEAKAQELQSDRPGRVLSASSRTIHHSFSSSTDPAQHILERFSREISDYLKRHISEFDQLTLVAEPHTLGILRRNLEDPVAEKLSETLSKDLTELTAREISEYMRSHRWEPIPVQAEHF